ncbi:MAG: hypothetical protein JST00_18270 [Deltaproteobacteria bacterium]|nr:hypothetical protein [Deltaproteobacteria bacterium]
MVRAALSVSLVLVASLAFACTSPDVHEATASAEAPLAAPTPSYPVHVEADPLVEARAREALAKVAPNAVLAFSRARGTPSSIGGLDLPLGACPRGRSTAPLLRTLIASHPDIFQIDPSEWASDVGPSCEAVSPEGEWVSWPRLTYGGAPMKHDVLGLRVRRLAFGVVRLEGIAGTYLPIASETVRGALAATAPFSAKAAEEQARASKLTYETFEWCIPKGSGSYAVGPADTFAVEGRSWRYDETATGVDLVERARATLRVAPANVTPELTSSNANCPLLGVPRVGWVLTFDTQKPSMLEAHPGIDCVVCAR